VNRSLRLSHHSELRKPITTSVVSQFEFDRSGLRESGAENFFRGGRSRRQDHEAHVGGSHRGQDRIRDTKQDERVLDSLPAPLQVRGCVVLIEDHAAVPIAPQRA
jgi:hypothetical protein